MDDVTREIVNRLKRNPQVLAAYLFGSRAVGLGRPDSDFDIAILLDPNRAYSLYEEGALVSELEGSGGAKIDTTVLNGKSPVLSFEAISPRKVIFSRDEDSRAEYEVGVCNRYYDDAQPYIEERYNAAVERAHRNLHVKN